MATLTTTITEEITLNGSDRGSTNTLSVGSVTQIFNRIVSCPSGQDTTIANFQAAVNTSDGALKIADAKYMRVTNLSSDDVAMSLQVSLAENGTADSSASVLLGAGTSFILGGVDAGIAVSDANADIIVAGSLKDLESIIIDGHGSNAVNIEVFVAS